MSAASLAGGLALPAQSVQAVTSQVTGTVFEDYNANGVMDTVSSLTNNGTGVVGVAVDRGVGGVTVTAYDAAGASVGSTTSTANGQYALSPTSAGPYRIEFTNLPTGYQPSFHGPAGVAGSNGTSVQFVAADNTGNVNFGILNPDSYCQNNPSIVANCYNFGGSNSGNASAAALYRFPYSAGSDSTASTAPYDIPVPTPLATMSQVGATFGLVYARNAQRLYAAAYFKKHVGFGPGADGAVDTADDAGAIYVVNPNTNAVVATFTVPNATTNAHNTADYLRDNFNVSWDAVGKTSLGGLALSLDESRLYVMNLEDRALYALNTSTGAVVVSATVPLNPPLPSGSCAAANVRPFAVEVFGNSGYAGLTCTGPTTADLRGYVYSFDLNTLAFGAAPVLQIPLNYDRGIGNTDPNIANSSQPAEWNVWTTSFAAKPTLSTDPNGIFPIYPQPMLSSLAFNMDGNLAIGLRDRFGDQMGNQVHSNAVAPTVYYYGVPVGDMLRACGDPVNGWTLESNARCGNTGTGPQNNGQGPGNGEFYWRDEYVPYHDEVSLGGLTQVPGFPDVVSSFYNPIPIDGNSDASFDGGVRWLNNTSGNYSKGYRVYNGTLANGNLFGKAAGLGDLTVLCDAAPMEIGNRVWDDVNGNGRQDANEGGLGGVQVSLRDAQGTPLTTTTTANDGTYYFAFTDAANSVRVQPNTGYQICVDITQAGLIGFTPAPGNASGDTSNSAIGDVTDSDGTPSGNCSLVTFMTGGPGATNHSFDFGFVPPQNARVSVGNQVWFDTNFDSQLNTGEIGVSGVRVDLYQDTNADCIFSTGDTFITTTVTIPGGYYTFTNLLPSTSPGSAYLTVIPRENFEGSGPLVGNENSPGDIACDVDANNFDHGIVNGTLGAGGSVSSRAISVTVGGELADDGDGDPSSNLTLDFGFRPILTPGTAALGDYVWLDNNKNGLQDVDEPGVENVTVNLYRSGLVVPISTTKTVSTGLYLFNNLSPDTYTVEFVKPTGSFAWTTQNSGDDSKDSDADTTTGRTTTIPLATGQTDLTWDAGLVCAANGAVRGRLNAGGISNIPILLLPQNVPGQIALVFPTRTDGSFEFKDIIPGRYLLQVHDPTLNYQGYFPVPGSDSQISIVVTGCDTTIAEFNYEKSPLGALGDFVWYDINRNALQDEWFDANGDGTVTKNQLNPDRVVPLSEYEWYDINNDGRNNGPENEGELRKCGLEVTTADLLTLYRSDALNTVAGALRTNVFGYYRFNGLQLREWAVKFRSTDAELDAKAKAMFATAKCKPLPGAPPAVDYPSGLAGQDVGIASASALPVACNISTKINDLHTLTEATPVYLDADFGILCADDLATIGDRVWLDGNRNGQQDGGEQGIPNVPVQLYTSVGVLISTTQTNEQGLYLFPGLVPGSYYVGITPPVSLVCTEPNAGSDDAIDSDINCDTSLTQIISVGPNESNLTLDAGFHPAGPTAITLSSFTAALRPEGGMQVTWRTSLEQNTFGFYVLRSATGKLADAIKVNSDLMLAKGVGQYGLIDPQGTTNASYWLQEIELDGTTLVYGPATMSDATPPTQAQPNVPMVVYAAGANPGGVPVSLGTTQPAGSANVPVQPPVQRDAPQAATIPGAAVQLASDVSENSATSTEPVLVNTPTQIQANAAPVAASNAVADEAAPSATTSQNADLSGSDSTVVVGADSVMDVARGGGAPVWTRMPSSDETHTPTVQSVDAAQALTLEGVAAPLVMGLLFAVGGVVALGALTRPRRRGR
jgi:hypothetical protein